MVESDNFQYLIAIALSEYEAKHSHASSEWEYLANSGKVNASRDFISFLNQMVLEQTERIQEEDEDEEPEHADA